MKIENTKHFIIVLFLYHDCCIYAAEKDPDDMYTTRLIKSFFCFYFLLYVLIKFLDLHISVYYMVRI